MNKIDNAWAVLKSLPAREQEIAAEAILDFAASADGPVLTDEQAAEVERRLRDRDDGTIGAAELRTRIQKLVP